MKTWVSSTAWSARGEGGKLTQLEYHQVLAKLDWFSCFSFL